MAINTGSKCILAILFFLGMCAFEATSRTLGEASLIQRHKQWMIRHARSYKNDVEKAHRFKIFKQNLEYIESFNKASNRTYKLGLNKFSDMSDEEFKATMLMDESNFPGRPNKFPKGKSIGKESYTYVPDRVNWIERGAVTGIRDQYECGSCWAFSAVAAIEGLYQIKTGSLVPLSEQQLLDCSTNNMYNNHGCKGGWPTEAFRYVQSVGGLVTEYDYPYQGYQGMCYNLQGYAPAATVTGFQQVPPGEAALLQAVSNQPVSIIIYLNGDELKHLDGFSGIFNGDCGSGKMHAMTVVGYDTTVDGERYWLIKNSWSTSWGDNGYFRMARDTIEGGLCGLATMASIPIFY